MKGLKEDLNSLAVAIVIVLAFCIAGGILAIPIGLIREYHNRLVEKEATEKARLHMDATLNGTRQLLQNHWTIIEDDHHLGRVLLSSGNEKVWFSRGSIAADLRKSKSLWGVNLRGARVQFVPSDDYKKTVEMFEKGELSIEFMELAYAESFVKTKSLSWK